MLHDPDRQLEEVGATHVAIDLNLDGNGEQRDHQRPRQSLLALEAEQQHESGQQCDKRDRLKPIENGLQPPFASRCLGLATQKLCNDRGNYDVERDRENQRLSRHGDRRHSQQQADDRREVEHHDGVVECAKPIGRLRGRWPSGSSLQDAFFL